MMIETTSSRLLHGLGFSNGCAEFGPEEAAAVGAELLDRDLGGHGPDGDRLGAPLERARLGSASKRHRHAGGHQQRPRRRPTAARGRRPSPRSVSR